MTGARANAGRRLVRVALAASLLVASHMAQARDLDLRPTGRPTVLYDSEKDACDPIDVPDVNPRAYRDNSGQVVMFALHYINRPLRGPDLTHLKLDCHVSLDSKLDPDPAHYDDRRYITATWTNDGRTVGALIHHEYHADQHKRCLFDNDLGCWFNTILAYRSTDGGANFSKASPLVVASAPFTQDQEQGRHRGFFNPSNIVADKGANYAFISTTGWDGQSAGSCLFRTANATTPAWHAFDGHAFSVRFEDPYRSKLLPTPCKTIEPFTLPVGSVVRHAPSGLWIAVFQATAGGVTPVDGFYYAVGRDLLHWSEPRFLMEGHTVYNDLCKVGRSIINYPSLLDPASASRNFDTVGDHPLLFFTKIGVKDCQTNQRLLVHQPIEIKLTDGAP